MARGITQEEVFQAADTLLAQGLRPTIERVRQQLGRGSPNTVNRELDSWWSSLSQRLGGGAQRSEAELPADLEKACQALYRQIRDKALSASNHTTAQVQKEIEAERNSLEKARHQLSIEKTAVQATIEALREDFQSASEQATSLLEEVSLLKVQLGNANIRAEKSELAMKLAVDERGRLMRRTEMEMQKLQSRWEGNERHWLIQIDRLREDAKQARSDHQAQTGLLGKQLKDIESQLLTCKRDLDQTRKRLGAAQKDLGTEREKRIAAESARKAVLRTGRVKKPTLGKAQVPARAPKNKNEKDKN